MSKLNGYRPTHRNKWFFIKHGILSIQEVSLWEYYADIFDFDINHDAFGTFEVDFEQISLTFHCKSDNTVRNWHKKLLSLGIIQETSKRQIYRLSNADRFISPGIWKGKSGEYAKKEKDQPIGIILQNLGIKFQINDEKVQPVGEKKEDLALEPLVKALSSSKDESNVYKGIVVISQSVRSEEEYEQIYKDMDGTLSIDDMRWIDQNITEKQEVYEHNEKDIVQSYFNGNWEKYRLSLIPA